MPRGRGRKLRRHIAWRVDADYRQKLSAEELSWLDQFEREYYDGHFKAGEESIHPPCLRTDCYRRAYAARSDVPTASSPTSCEPTAAAQHDRYYDPADFVTTTRIHSKNDAEETLLEALAQKAA